jgi:type I restriction enzyme S subunit
MAATKNTKPFYNSEIPSDWEHTELGKKLDVLTGFAFPSDKFSESGVKLLRGSNVKRNQVDWKNDITRFWPYEKKLQKYELKLDDLVIALDGALIGRSFAKIKEEDLPAYLVQRVARLRGKGLDQSFLHTLFTQRSFEMYVDSVKTHTAIPHISPTDIKKFKVNLPPLPEQKAIAQVLSTADAAIQTIEKLIAKKELRKKWLMQQLLSGKKRLKGFSGEWKKEKLEKYLVKHDEKTTSNNQYPVLTSSRKGIFLQSEYYTRDVASEDNTRYNVVPRGYFTYRHMSDDLIFKFNINDIVDRGIVSTLYPVFTTRDINDYFLKSKLNDGSEFKMHAGEQKQGGSRTYVYFNTLCQLKLNMPSIEEQIAIAQVLQAADKEISLLKAKGEKLREQKKGLMQQLLTGKVRLKIN